MCVKLLLPVDVSFPHGGFFIAEIRSRFNMNSSTLSLIISIIALILVLAKWFYDFQSDKSKHKRGRRRFGAQVRIEFLAGKTNCFITHGGSILFLISFRIYNDNDHIPVTIDKYEFLVKNGYKWQETQLYESPQAAFFPSLLRHNVPFRLAPEQREDFYEIFQLNELLSSTEAKVKLRCIARGGKKLECVDRISHRLDDRPVFDILFKTLGV